MRVSMAMIFIAWMTRPTPARITNPTPGLKCIYSVARVITRSFHISKKVNDVTGHKKSAPLRLSRNGVFSFTEHSVACLSMQLHRAVWAIQNGGLGVAIHRFYQSAALLR